MDRQTFTTPTFSFPSVIKRNFVIPSIIIKRSASLHQKLKYGQSVKPQESITILAVKRVHMLCTCTSWCTREHGCADGSFNKCQLAIIRVCVRRATTEARGGVPPPPPPPPLQYPRWIIPMRKRKENTSVTLPGPMTADWTLANTSLRMH